MIYLRVELQPTGEFGNYMVEYKDPDGSFYSDGRLVIYWEEERKKSALWGLISYTTDEISDKVYIPKEQVARLSVVHEPDRDPLSTIREALRRRNNRGVWERFKDSFWDVYYHLKEKVQSRIAKILGVKRKNP